MSGKAKVYGLVMVGLAAAAFVVLATGESSAGAPDDPCGGHYVGEGLKASFSDSYVDAGVPVVSTITNDIPYPYQYSVPDGDCVFYFRNGHIIVMADRVRNQRFVKMHFDGQQEFPTDEICAPNPYFFDPNVDETAWPRWFQFRTSGGYTWSRDAEGKLILYGTGVNFNWMGMADGQVGYCDTGMKFAVLADADPTYDESLDEYWTSSGQVKVVCSRAGGKLKWTLTPVSEPFSVVTETKTKKQVIVSTASYDNALLRTVISNMRSRCLHGTFLFLFELTIEQQ